MDEILNLTRYGRMAQRHWETHRPRMVAHLKQTLMYHQALLNAQERTRDLVTAEVRRGNDVDSAREMALAMFVLLPSEAELPTLPADRMPFSQPESTIESLTQTT